MIVMHQRTLLSRNAEVFRAALRGLKISSASCGSQGLRTVIHVEGNIASGKSSIMEHVKSIATPVSKRKGAQSSVLILPEPIEKWENLNGRNLLKLFYADKKNKSVMFQTWVHLTLLQQAVEASRKRSARVILCERSIISGRFVFTECLHANGEMTVEERAVLDQLFRFHWKHFERQLKPDIIVYLRASPTTCSQRIRTRNRDGEASLPLEYLQRLHELHEQLYVRHLAPAASDSTASEIFGGHVSDARHSIHEMIDSCLHNIPVIVIDAERSIETVQNDFVERVSKAIEARQAAMLNRQRIDNTFGTTLANAHATRFDEPSSSPQEAEVESEQPHEMALGSTSG